MSLQPRWLLALSLILIGLANRSTGAEPAKVDMDAIAKTGEAFIAAFHKGDAKGLAAFWTADGDYTGLTGRKLKGREAIEDAFKGLFADNKGLKLQITSDSLRFITPDVAIEEGTTEVFTPDRMPPSRARFTNILVKKDGNWLLSSVKDAPFAAPSNYEHLQGLSWAVGDWTSEPNKGEAEHLSVTWGENQNFIHATFSTTVKGVPIGSATQWVGWDPEGKRIRSWIFDSTGGFGEGSWSQDGKKWSIKIKSTLQNGKKATATVVIGPVDADTITILTKDRTVDGQAVPDTKETQLKRIIQHSN